MHFPSFVSSRSPMSPASVQCANAKLSQPYHFCWTTSGHGHTAVKRIHNCVTVFFKTKRYTEARKSSWTECQILNFCHENSSISQVSICSSMEIPPNKSCCDYLFSLYPLILICRTSPALGGDKAVRAGKWTRLPFFVSLSPGSINQKSSTLPWVLSQPSLPDHSHQDHLGGSLTACPQVTSFMWLSEDTSQVFAEVLHMGCQCHPWKWQTVCVH